MSLKVLDVFSGIGGFSLGLERAGMKTVAFCEVDPRCQEVLKKHWPKVPIFSDIRNLNSKILLREGIRNVDMLTAGFPCQDVSIANIKGQGLKGEKSGLWKEVKRLISELKPQYALIENVPNLRIKGLGEVLKDLWEVGYGCEWHIISSASLGPHCPHIRERIWILAYSDRPGRPLASSQWGEEESSTSPNHCAAFSILQNESFKVANCSNEVSRFRAEKWQKLTQKSSLHWKTEPSVGRVVDGLSHGLDRFRKERIKQLGNAVVPQIVELIGRAILGFESSALP